MVIDAKGASPLGPLVFVTFIGVAFLVSAVWAAKYQYTILKTWPAVEAEVAKCELVSHRTSKGSLMYHLELELRYTAGGNGYVTPLPSSSSSSSLREMKRRAEAYAPGRRHEIRYNPDDPNDIRLNLGYTFGFFAMPIIFGAAGLIVTGVGILLLRKLRPRRCPSCGQPVRKWQKFCPNCAMRLHARSLSEPPR